MKFESGDLATCVTCGTQYDNPLTSPPESCRICDDPRQYVPPQGQIWTSLNKASETQENTFSTDDNDTRIHYITTQNSGYNPINPAFGKEKQLGIGQRAILIQTPHGNVLWDLIAYLDDETVQYIKDKGGLKAIAISHPHFYTTHLEWARVFDCPVYICEKDAEWFNRKDGEGRRVLVGDSKEILPGVTMVRVGGHFDGSAVLHWDNNLFHADSFMVAPSANPHPHRRPGSTSYSFMWSYPNMIPLAPPAIHGIWTALKPYNFTATYGGFLGQNHRGDDLKRELLDSMKIFVRRSGHADAEVLREEV